MIPRGRIVSLIGPNGAGKTTFFNQITGLLHPTSGDIIFDGASILGLAPHDIAELGIGRTFQNIRLFGAMTVLANVMVGQHSRMKASWWGSLLGLRGVREEEERTAAARPRAARLRRPAASLRGGLGAATCPTATSAGSRSPAPWRPSQSCCCSTSRRPA